MFQVAMLSVSSSLEDGIPAFAILDCRTLRPLAISGEIFPWFMMIPLYERPPASRRSEEHTSELQSLTNLVCRLLLEKKKQHKKLNRTTTRTNYTKHTTTKGS